MISTLKKFLFALLFTLFTTVGLLASPLATFNYKIFYIPNKGPVIETHLDVSGNSIMLGATDDEDLWAGRIELTLIFKQGEKIITFDKKVLDSPLMSPTERSDFMDIQRFVLPSGTYQLEILLKDLLDEGASVQDTEIEILIPAAKAGIFQSDIELISAYKRTTTPGPFTKSGFDLLPMVNDDVLNQNMNEVMFYSEIYNTAESLTDDMFLVRAYLADTINGDPIPSTLKNDRRNTAEVIPVLMKLPLQDVPTGPYNLIVEAISKDNELISRQALGIYRLRAAKAIEMNAFNKKEAEKSWVSQYTNKEELFQYIRCLRPIATDREIITLDHTFGNYEETEVSYMQQYFYVFWISRNEKESESEWLQYRDKVVLVEREYGTRNKRGYETDRGRVFLKYGPPNDIQKVDTEPASYPYELWRYYRAGIYNNVKFVFYDPTLLGTDFELIHCEYIPGETNNPKWKDLLKQRTGTGIQEYGGRIDENFDNPR